MSQIGDFGFSTQFSPGELSHTFCGSPAYAAPELFKGRPYMASAVDMWALGVLLHQCLTAELPFPDRSLSLLFKVSRCVGLPSQLLLPRPHAWRDPPSVPRERAAAFLTQHVISLARESPTRRRYRGFLAQARGARRPLTACS